MMSRRSRKLWVLLATGAIAAVALLFGHARQGGTLPVQVLAADAEYKWYRGNLHTHTLWSDGDDYPEMVALWYKDHGYDFLSFTDHNTLQRPVRWIDSNDNKGKKAALEKLLARFPENWVETRVGGNGRTEIRLKTFDEIASRVAVPGKFLLIEGEEISDEFQGVPIHLNATNVAETIPPMKGNDIFEVMQRNTTALFLQRKRTGRPMIIHLNHPNFHYAITAEDLARVRGENLFEVYNGHPQVNNQGDEYHASAERMWDIILTLRVSVLQMPLMFGLATDDAHSYHEIPSRNSEPGRGWIEVLAKDLTPQEIVHSVEIGMFYASTGVKLERLFVSNDKIKIVIQAEEGVVYRIDFVGTRMGYDKQSEPIVDRQGREVRSTAHYSNDIGRVLKTVDGARGEYIFEPTDFYVRARITSSKKHPNPSVPGEYQQAWCQPVRGPAGRYNR